MSQSALKHCLNSLKTERQAVRPLMTVKQVADPQVAMTKLLIPRSIWKISGCTAVLIYFCFLLL